MWLELSRVWSNYRDKGLARLLCDIVVIPFLVALMLMFAYVCRDNANDHRTSFVYFCTLYSFWCGLFGSCQAFNGEAASGEWSYWVLGQRRPIMPHLAAHFGVGLASAVVQLTACACFMGIFSLFVPDASLIRTIADMLASGGDYGLPGYWCLLNCGGEAHYYLAVLKYLFAGLFAAALAGTCMGMLISSLFRNPQASLSASVCLIVACSVLSQTSIRGLSGNNARDFAPVSLVVRQRMQCARHHVEFCRYKSENLTAWKNGGAVELSSWLLPQRFFFNIARIPFFKLEAGRVDRWQEDENLCEHQKFWNESAGRRDCITNEVCGCLCPVCIGLVKVSRETGGNEDSEKYFILDSSSADPVPYDKHWLHSARDTEGRWKELLPGADISRDAVNHVNHVATQELIDETFCGNRGGIQSYVRFFHEMLWGEMAVISVQSLLMLFISFVLLKKKEVFNELR